MSGHDAPLRLALVAALAVTLGGCRVLFPASVPDPYVAYHLAPVDSGTAAAVTTRGATRPRRLVIDLPSALELAGGRSPEVALARVGQRQAENVTFAHQFSLVPGITPLFRAFSHQGQAQPQTGTDVSVTRTNFLAQPVIAARWWPGPVVFELLASARREDAAGAATEAVQQQVRLEVAKGYFELVRGYALVAIAKEAVAEATEQKRFEESLLAKGAGIRAHVLRATAELADRQQGLVVARKKVAVAAAGLASLLQLDADVELVPADDFPAPTTIFPPDVDVTALIRTGFDARPELHEARAELSARDHDRDDAVFGPLTPFVVPLIQVGGFGPTLGQLHFSQDAMVIVGWNVGPGGILDIPRIRAASYRLQEQHLAIDVLRARVQREVAAAKAKAVAAEEGLEASKEEVEAAAEYLRLAKDRLAKGATIQLEVLDAQRAFVRARGRAVEAIVDYDDAQWELLRATGRPYEATR